LILISLGLVACENEPTSLTVTRTRPQSSPVPSRTPEPVVVRPTGIPEIRATIPLPGEKILETEHFAFYAEDGYLPIDIATFAGTAEAIYDVVSVRMGAGSPKSVILSFRPLPMKPALESLSSPMIRQNRLNLRAFWPTSWPTSST
jgi:hypothetical protein